MTSVTFVDGDGSINADWLNEVNDFVHGGSGTYDPENSVTDQAQDRQARNNGTSDLDQIIKSGFYKYDSATINAPDTNAGMIIVSATNTNITNYAYSLVSGVAYTRFTTDGSSWSTWVEGTNKAYVDTKVDLDGSVPMTGNLQLPAIAPSSSHAIRRDYIDNVTNKSAAVLKSPVARERIFVESSDGGFFIAKVGAAPGTYSDDGGTFCGTVFIPTGGDGSSAWVRDFNTGTHAEWYGLSAAATNAANTLSLQAAIDTQAATIIFPFGQAIPLNEVEIKTSVHIVGNGCILETGDNALFKVAQNIAGTVVIEGFAGVDWGALAGTVGREFFYNISDGGTGSTSFPSGTEYDITKLVITNNVLGISKITVSGVNTTPHIHDNTWIHSAGVSSAPFYLYCTRGALDTDAGPVYIQDNIFDVYPPDSLNADILKVTGGISRAKIDGNHFANNNVNCAAEVDVFTGAHKMRFTNNHLVNAQLNRKQVQGSNPSVNKVYSYDLIHGNTFELQDGNLARTAINAIGSLFTISDNQMVLSHTTAETIGIRMVASDALFDADPIGLALTDESSAAIMSKNIIDMRGTFTGSTAFKHEPGTLGAGYYLVVSENIVIGGYNFISSGTQYTTLIGNIWASSSNATGISFNTLAPSMAVGNIADTAAPIFVGQDSGNRVTQLITDISAADTTPSVLGESNVTLSNGSSITDFDDGYVGQSVTFIGSGAGATIIHNSSIVRLNGSANVVLTAGSTLTLLQWSASIWVETGRNIQ